MSRSQLIHLLELYLEDGVEFSNVVAFETADSLELRIDCTELPQSWIEHQDVPDDSNQV